MLVPESRCLHDINITLISWRNALVSKSNSCGRQRRRLVGAVLLLLFASVFRRTIRFHCSSTGIFLKRSPLWREGRHIVWVRFPSVINPVGGLYKLRYYDVCCYSSDLMQGLLHQANQPETAEDILGSKFKVM